MGRIIDLSLPIGPDLRGVAIDVAKELEMDGWNASTLHLYSHAGTHLDASFHFGVGSQTIDHIPLERCMGPAWVADLTGVGPQELITVEHLGALAEKIAAGDNLLLRTGWSKRLAEPAYRDQLPRVSEELARWLVARKVNLLGVEPPSVADVNNLEEVTRIHRILFEGDVLIVEGLANLEEITQEKIIFMAIPLRITGGDGSPVRALAVEED